MIGAGRRAFGYLLALAALPCTWIDVGHASLPEPAFRRAGVQVGERQLAPPASSRVIMADAIAGAARVPSDFMLEMESGGGFTGVHQGSRITADGKVVRWRTGPNASRKTEEVLGTVDQAALLKLIEAVDSAKFFEVALDQPGNMTVTLTCTRDGRQHAVRYPLPMDRHPEAVRPVVEAFKAVTKPLEAARAAPE
jgi:hypothetical protein